MGMDSSDLDKTISSALRPRASVSWKDEDTPTQDLGEEITEFPRYIAIVLTGFYPHSYSVAIFIFSRSQSL